MADDRDRQNKTKHRTTRSASHIMPQTMSRDLRLSQGADGRHDWARDYNVDEGMAFRYPRDPYQAQHLDHIAAGQTEHRHTVPNLYQQHSTTSMYTYSRTVCVCLLLQAIVANIMPSGSKSCIDCCLRHVYATHSGFDNLSWPSCSRRLLCIRSMPSKHQITGVLGQLLIYMCTSEPHAA